MEYDLIVKVIDKGSFLMSEVIFVYIFVIVVDNVFLKFIFKDYFVEISEIVSIGSFVGMVIVYS